MLIFEIAGGIVLAVFFIAWLPYSLFTGIAAIGLCGLVAFGATSLIDPSIFYYSVLFAWVISTLYLLNAAPSYD